MKNVLFALLAVLLIGLASSCRVLSALEQTPDQRAGAKVANLLAEHPGLVKPDTVRVLVPFAVPEIRFVTKLVQVHDTVYVQRDLTRLDSVLAPLGPRVDSLQLAAVRAQLHRLLLDRPVLQDTLCFDTLGVAGRLWRVGRQYRLLIVRNRLAGTTSAPVAVQRLVPCASPGAEPFGLFRPASWGLPYYGWLSLGFLLGLVLGFLLCRSLARRANA